MGDLQSDLEQRLQRANQEAGGLLDRWVAGVEPADYRHRLLPERCLMERPSPGFEETCGECRGRCRVTCPRCNGQQRVQCEGCRGSGTVSCQNCGGHGSTTCNACHGQGYIEKRELEMNYGDRQSTMNQPRELVHRVPCGTCGAQGRIPCTVCSNGLVTCPGCGGNKIVNCPRCGAAGTVPCSGCDATGRVHHTGWVKGEVTRTRTVDLSNASAEDHRTFLERIPFEQIGALADAGGVRLGARPRTGLQLKLYYSATAPVDRIKATAAGASITISAYGPDREIFDYRNLAGRLLEPDLATLERLLVDRSVLRPGALASAALGDGVRRFLASEINVSIAEGGKDFDTLVGLGWLTRSYIERAAAASSKAAPSLYGPVILPLALWLTLAISVIFWVVRTNSTLSRFAREYVTWNPDERFYLMMALTAIGWAIVELRANAVLASILGANIYPRVKGSFDRTRMIVRLIIPAVVFGFSWWITFFIFQLILHFRYGNPLRYFP